MGGDITQFLGVNILHRFVVLRVLACRERINSCIQRLAQLIPCVAPLVTADIMRTYHRVNVITIIVVLSAGSNDHRRRI